MSNQTADQMVEKKASTDPDWKAIASELAGHVLFAIQYLKAASGSGMVGNFDENPLRLRHWREPMADTLEKIPGVSVDREAMKLLDLPQSKYRKALSELEARRDKGKKP